MEDQSEGLGQMYRDLGEALSGLAATRFTGTSEDGYVTVTATAEGVPVDVDINPRIRRLDSDDIEASVLQAIAAACDAAHAGKEQVLQSVFGPDYTVTPSSGESELEHTRSMIRSVGRHARQKYHGGGRGGGQ